MLLTHIEANLDCLFVCVCVCGEGGGSIVQLYNWYRQLSKEGQKFGYLVNGTKSWPILGFHPRDQSPDNGCYPPSLVYKQTL